MSGRVKGRVNKMERRCYGKLLEDIVEKYWCDGKHVVMSKPSDDRLRGTDLFFYRLPVDVTLTIESKDHCHRIGQYSYKIANEEIFKVDIGVRFGNKAKSFDEPVLVIGFNVTLFRDCNWQVQQLTHKDIDNISEMYYNHLDMIDGNLKEVM